MSGYYVDATLNNGYVINYYFSSMPEEVVDSFIRVSIEQGQKIGTTITYSNKN